MKPTASSASSPASTTLSPRDTHNAVKPGNTHTGAQSAVSVLFLRHAGKGTARHQNAGRSKKEGLRDLRAPWGASKELPSVAGGRRGALGAGSPTSSMQASKLFYAGSPTHVRSAVQARLAPPGVLSHEGHRRMPPGARPALLASLCRQKPALVSRRVHTHGKSSGGSAASNPIQYYIQWGGGGGGGHRACVHRACRSCEAHAG